MALHGAEARLRLDGERIESTALKIVAAIVLGALPGCFGGHVSTGPDVGSVAGEVPLPDTGAQGEPLEFDPRGMVVVPEGVFNQGTFSTSSNLDERPEHPVFMPAFLIDVTEVTVGQYRRCVAAAYCSAHGVNMRHFADAVEAEEACNYFRQERSEHPMNCVSWHQAQRYCTWVGKRLPTEAEWEKAARGPTGSWMYTWGDRPPERTGRRVANLADETARRRFTGLEIFPSYDDGYAETAPVGSFPHGASVFGALDMIGNVLEWTADTYDPDRYLRTAAEVAQGATVNPFKVARGGGWDSFPATVRISRRWGFRPEDRTPSLGFRCAADVSGQ
jgi:formylglycine-generating enzyme required for sulfatase activity